MPKNSMTDSSVGHGTIGAGRATAFESLESAHDYVAVLREVLDSAHSSILDDTAVARETKGAERRVDALHVVEHKLNQLRQHLLASLILLNDLRMLRRLLLGERGSSRSVDES
jgi:hypothetical protein